MSPSAKPRQNNIAIVVPHKAKRAGRRGYDPRGYSKQCLGRHTCFFIGLDLGSNQTDLPSPQKRAPNGSDVDIKQLLPCRPVKETQLPRPSLPHSTTSSSSYQK